MIFHIPPTPCETRLDEHGADILVEVEEWHVKLFFYSS